MPDKLHILVIRFSSIGDILLTTPILRAIKARYGNTCVLHYATKKEMLRWIENNPHIDQIHALEKGESVLTFAKNLRKNYKIDAIVDLHSNLRTFIIKAVFSGVYSKSFPKMNIRKWLYVQLKWNRMPDVHVVDRYFEAVQFLGVENDGLGLEYVVPKQDIEKMQALLDNHGIKEFVAITVSAKFATKALPVSKMIELIELQKEPVVLLGGPDDLAKANEVMLGLKRSGVLQLAGELSPNESAAMLQLSTRVIAHDTGLMHLASAFKKPITVYWGNTTPAIGMGPYLPDTASKAIYKEVLGLSCRPCSKIGYNKCPKGHFDCMQKQELS